jgi:mono/diheme cytochrome c family protein
MWRMRKAGLVLLTILAGTATGAQAQSATAKADAEAGREIAVRWCQECHIVGRSQARASDAAPSFVDLADTESVSRDRLRGFLAAPKHPMPPLELSGKEIDDLIAYIRSLSSK